jgi:hypothetical protein
MGTDWYQDEETGVVFWMFENAKVPGFKHLGSMISYVQAGDIMRSGLLAQDDLDKLQGSFERQMRALFPSAGDGASASWDLKSTVTKQKYAAPAAVNASRKKFQANRPDFAVLKNPESSFLSWVPGGKYPDAAWWGLQRTYAIATSKDTRKFRGGAKEALGLANDAMNSISIVQTAGGIATIAVEEIGNAALQRQMTQLESASVSKGIAIAAKAADIRISSWIAEPGKPQQVAMGTYNPKTNTLNVGGKLGHMAGTLEASGSTEVNATGIMLTKRDGVIIWDVNSFDFPPGPHFSPESEASIQKGLEQFFKGLKVIKGE